MSQEQQYKYFAFISYNYQDTEWGKRLQKKLEGYRMPATLCSEHGWNRKPIKPVFFAPTDIQPGGLTVELQERLKASRHLIVICSPNSAKSEWVGEEIAYFHSLGRTDNIHFFIVDGVPHSGNEETECFNPIVKTLGIPEILGANIHEKVSRWPWINRERAYVQLITKLLGVEFDSIWQRHKRMLIRKCVAWMVGALVVIAAIIGIWKISQSAVQGHESRTIAEKALQLAEEGDVYLAKLLLLNTIPQNLEHPERPLTPESVSALAKIFDEESGIIKGHSFEVGSVAYSPDGKTIISSDMRTFRIWDALTGKCLWSQYGDSPKFSPDGKAIVSVSFDTVRIWNSITGKPVCPPLQHKEFVTSASYSPDGKTIVSTSGNKAMIWNPITGKQICPPLQHKEFVTSASYSPDGKTIVSTSGNKAMIWNPITGKQICSPLQHKEIVNSASYSPDSKTIVTASQSEVKMWDVLTGNCLWSQSGHSPKFSPDGKTILTKATWSTANILDAKTGECLYVKKCNTQWVNSVSYSPDGKTIVAVSSDSTAKIWDAKTGKQIDLPLQHKSCLHSVSYSPDGKTIATTSLDSTASLWDATTGKRLDHKGGIKSVVFSPNGKKVVAVSYDNTIRIWDVDASSEEMWKTLPRKTGQVCSLPKRPNSKIAVTKDNQNYLFWDVSTGKYLNTLLAPVFFANISGTRTDHGMMTFRYKSGECCHNLADFHLLSGTYSTNGKTIVIPLQEIVVICDASMSLKENQPILAGHRYLVNSAAYSPDGKTIVTVSCDSTARIWNASTRKAIHHLRGDNGHKGIVYSAEYSNNGKTIVTTSSDNTIKLWTSTGKFLRDLTWYRAITASFSPDDKNIITTTSDGEIRIWDVSSGGCLKIMNDIPKSARERVVSASYSPDGKSIVVILSSGTAMIRKAPPTFQEMLEITRERFKNRKLTREEKRRFYLE